MLKIRDAIARANPTVSRQRLWQLRRKKKGLCIICGAKAVTSLHCAEHAKNHSINVCAAIQRRKERAG